MIDIPAFLITTYHNRETRWKRIIDHLVEINLHTGVIMAPDFNMFIHTTLNPEQYKQQSLTLAYYQACQTAVMMDMDEFVILEDDLKVLEPALLSDLIDNLPDNFDLCYLTRTDHNDESAETKPHNSHFDKVVKNWWETPITLWSRSFALAFIDHIEKKLETGLWLGHIDHEILKMNETGNFAIFGSKFKTAVGLSNTPQNEMSLEGSISVSTN